MDLKEPRRSTLQVFGLPDSVGAVFLTVSLALALSPYLAGSDFGAFKIPTFPAGTQNALKVLGPVLFLAAGALFLPVWRRPPEQEEPPKASSPLRAVPGGVRLELAAPHPAPLLVGTAISRYRGWRFRNRAFYDDLATVVTELSLNCFRHGKATVVTLGFYRSSIVIQDNGTPFNPLEAPELLSGPGGAGLFALNHFLHNAKPAVAPVYHRRGDPPCWNELVFYIVAEKASPSARSRVALRGRTDLNALEHDENIAHVLDLQWGYRHYMYDDDVVSKQTYRTYVISLKGNLIEDILERLPPGAVLHIKKGGRQLGDAYARRLADRFPGRLTTD